MKRVINIIVLCLALCFPPSYLQAGEVWKIASLNWEPYSSSTMNNQGNSIQKLRSLLEARDIELVVEFYPWKRARQIAKGSGYVGYFPAWLEEVDNGFVPSAAVDNSWIAVLKKPGSTLQYANLSELFERYRVGLVGSYDYPESIAALAAQHDKSALFSQSEMSLLKMLDAGRFDCAVTDPYVMTFLSQKQGMYEVEIDRVLMKKELVLAIKDDDKNPARVQLLKELLEKSSKGVQ